MDFHHLIYKNGNNKFQNTIYRKMALYNRNKGIDVFGKSPNGNTYAHLLTESNFQNNFINNEIYETAKQRFLDHKAGDFNRLKYNTASSQTCCFNLFAPLKNNLQLANKVFSQLLNKQIDIKHIEIEFTPNTIKELPGFALCQDESIGDQSKRGGTDADVAVFYQTDDLKKGVLLVEFKYIEDNFSKCSSYGKKKDIRSLCHSKGYYTELIEGQKKDERNNPLCGYLKYNNWDLMKNSSFIDLDKVRKSEQCPFRFSLNQLWRNVILAEQVKKARRLDECSFHILHPSENIYLLQEYEENVEQLFRKILTPHGNEAFKIINLEKIVRNIESLALDKDYREWIGKFKNRYLDEEII